MSDVIVSTTESTTNVTTTNDVTTIAVTDTTVEVSSSTAGIQGASYNPGDPVYVYVRNATGALLSKGTIVYVSGANGTHTQVTPALATGDATSARTLGWLAQDLANNASGLCCIEGYLEGIDTQGVTEGAQLYLSPTVAGGFTETKPSAPNHMVYVGVCAKRSAGNGKVFVKVQNGYELEELHDVAVSSPTNNQVLTYETSTGLWKNKDNTADGVQSIVFTSPITGGTVTSAGTVGLDQSLLSITRSQVSDFTGGTVANISGTVTQSQVTNLTTDLAGKAVLTGGNSFTGAQIISASTATQIPLQIRAASTPTVNVQEWDNSAGAVQASIDSNFRGNFPRVTAGSTADLGYAILSVNTGATANIGQVIRGVAGQSANLIQIETSSATAIFVTSAGNLNATGQVRVGTTSGLGQLAVVIAGTATVGAVVRGAASQSANLQEWQSSSGSTAARVEPSGNIVSGQNVIGLGSIHSYNLITSGSNATQYGSATLSIGTRGTANVGVIVQGVSGQSANALEIQSSTGATAIYMQAGGALRAGILQGGSGAETDLRSGSGGGLITMLRGTATPTNPGANYARLYFRAGTNANTLKLVVIAGAAGAETTILDNIPT